MVVIGQNELYSGKSGCGRAKVDLFVQSGCIREFFNTESGCIPAKMVHFRESGCIPAKVGVFGQKWLYTGKLVVFGLKWLNSGKAVVFAESGCIRAE